MNQNAGSNKITRKLAAIMFTDIVGYSKMMGENEDETFHLLEKYDNLVSPIIAEHNGTILKKLGDGMFCEFSSAVNAVDCALVIQKSLHEQNESLALSIPLLVRIGIHVGDVIIKDDDLFGDGVNIAARIESNTQPGGICISESVHSAVSSHPHINIKDIGPHSLKNISKPHHLYQVVTGFESDQKKGKKVQAEKSTKSHRTIKSEISDQSGFFSLKKLVTLVMIIIGSILVIIYYQQFLNVFNSDSQGSMSELSESTKNDFSPELMNEINEILSSEKAKKLFTEISGLYTVDALLEYLLNGRDAGNLAFGRREDFFDPQDKYVIILDEKKVHTVLYYRKSVYFDLMEENLFSELNQKFKGKRTIWIELL